MLTLRVTTANVIPQSLPLASLTYLIISTLTAANRGGKLVMTHNGKLAPDREVEPWGSIAVYWDEKSEFDEI